MKNMEQVQQMLKQVQQFQEQLQKQLEELVVESSTGGGMVTVRMNGQKHLVSVRIDPEVYKSGDIEMLQDLLLAAVNESARKIDEQVANQMGSLAGGLNLPGLNF
ncbi:MAG: YbaB/EbfC family nucleoid-associated protein [Acidobacteriota bacterium]